MNSAYIRNIALPFQSQRICCSIDRCRIILRGRPSRLFLMRPFICSLTAEPIFQSIPRPRTRTKLFLLNLGGKLGAYRRRRRAKREQGRKEAESTNLSCTVPSFHVFALVPNTATTGRDAHLAHFLAYRVTGGVGGCGCFVPFLSLASYQGKIR